MRYMILYPRQEYGTMLHPGPLLRNPQMLTPRLYLPGQARSEALRALPDTVLKISSPCTYQQCLDFWSLQTLRGPWRPSAWMTFQITSTQLRPKKPQSKQLVRPRVSQQWDAEYDAEFLIAIAPTACQHKPGFRLECEREEVLRRAPVRLTFC